ncbi:MAG: AAA family ATPase [Deltaproteobacteria bacterium]|nr:AAA family ATPase [Deltaproteobacteria bacterium]
MVDGSDRQPDGDAASEQPAEASRSADSLARRRSRPLDEDVLDELSALIADLPEPLAAVAIGVEIARDEGDATGVRKRLFELGAAVVRYALSIELALLAAELGDHSVPRPLGKELSRAARLTDGQWCKLARTAASQLKPLVPDAEELFRFLNGKPLATLLDARNRFVHGGGAGDHAPEQTLALLHDAERLLSAPLRVITALDPPSYQERHGVPLRPGVWRRQRQAVPTGLSTDVPHFVLGERWLVASPWLPLLDKKLVLIDAPHSAGASWRWVDAETGEHRESPELHEGICALVGQDARAPVVPSEEPGLVIRPAVMGTLRRAAEQAQNGAIGVIVLTGPQGIGRGRMLEAMQTAAAGFGFDQVVAATCLEQRRGVLRPLRRAVRDVTGLEGVTEALGQACAGDGLGSAESLDAAIEAVEEAILETAAGRPLLMLIDDAQWADDATLSLLSMLTDRATRKAWGRLLVVVAVRDEPHASAGLTSFIGQVERDVGPGATRVPLEPLDGKQSKRLVRAVAPLSPDLEEVVLEGAAGVPFFLVQSVLAWWELGLLRWGDGAWHPVNEGVLHRSVPGVAELVHARLVSFFEPGSVAARTAAQVLLCVGLSGSWLAVAQLVEVMTAFGSDDEAIEHALESLVAAGLLMVHVERHEYGFAQPMVRQAVVADLRDKPWAPRLHRCLLDGVAQADRRGEDAAFVAAGHLRLGNEEQAARHLRRAVDHSLAMGLFRQAVEQAEQLVELTVDAGERMRAGLLVVEALLRAGQPEQARRRQQQLEAGGTYELGDSIWARVLAQSIAHALGDTAEQADPQLVLDADDYGDVRLAVEARLAMARLLRAARGLAIVDEAIAALPAADHGDLRYRVLVLRVELLYETRALSDPECRGALEQARAAAEQLGSTWAVLDAENDWAALESSAGNQKQAIKLFGRVAKQAKKRHFGRLRRGALVNLATCQLRAGAPERAAEAAVLAATESREAADWSVHGMAQSVHADALRQAGKLDEARAAIDEAIEVKQRSRDPNVAIALLRRADILAEMGQGQAAAADAELAWERARQAGNDDQIARARLWLGLAAEAGADDDGRSRLADLVEELGPKESSLRGPTRKLLDEARQRLT